MNRRKMLTSLSGAGMALIAGCSGGGGGGGGPERGQTKEYEIGKQITHSNLEVTVHDYEIADRFAIYRETSQEERQAERSEFTDRNWTEPPTAGGAFLMLHLSVTHVGEGKQMFPGKQDISVVYRDETTPKFPIERNLYFRANDSDRKSFIQQISESSADENGAFPGVTISGWMLFEVPSEFNGDEMYCDITWGETSETFRWSITPVEVTTTTENSEE